MMKFVISESRFNEIVYNKLDEILSSLKILGYYSWDDIQEKHDESISIFYSTIPGLDDDALFRYYTAEVFEKGEFDEELRKKYIEDSPILKVFCSEPPFKKLSLLFNEYWKREFPKWFEKNFPNLEVKTYIFK